MKISVTEDHIRRGVPTDPNSCAVALALLEQVPQAFLATVSGLGLSIRVSAPTDSAPLRQFVQTYANLPFSILRFAGAFDRGEAVKPFEFELGAPTYSLERYSIPPGGGGGGDPVTK